MQDSDQPLDPALAVQLRAAADKRIRAQIAAAKKTADQRREDRRQFATRRRIGLRERHATKTARLQLADHHDQKGQP